MDRISPDPSSPLPAGKTWTWTPRDEAWVRIYHKDFLVPDAVHMRAFGPTRRFDHHTPGNPRPCPNGREIIYLAATVRSAVAEVFGGMPIYEVCPNWHLAWVRPTASLTVQDLVGPGGMAIGRRPWLGSGPVRPDESQAFAREVYEQRPDLAGIRYRSSSEEGICLALWERAPRLEIVQDGGSLCDSALVEPSTWQKVCDEYKPTGQALAAIPESECFDCEKAATASHAASKHEAQRPGTMPMKRETNAAA